VHPDQELAQVHVPPGESRLIREPGILCTLLGSCVGITFWVERLRIGALCHPMLPALPAPRLVPADNASARRYVDFTIRDLASQFDALGVTRQETEVKVFGGADVLEMDRSHSRPTVGKLNREAAERILRAEGYKVAASSLGGDEGMQIHFNTGNGEVLLRRFGRAPGTERPHKHRPSKARTDPWN
jgi:chemotaxis protein CheD